MKKLWLLFGIPTMAKCQHFDYMCSPSWWQLQSNTMLRLCELHVSGEQRLRWTWIEANFVACACVCARPLFVNERCSWQAFCPTGCSLDGGHRNQRSFHLTGQPKLGPYARLQGHWRHPTPSSKGRQLSQGPNNSQRAHTCSDSHAPLHTHTHTHTHGM